MEQNRQYDVLILGGGPGGYTAALYAARAGRRVLVLEKLSPGGQMTLTQQLDNYPGFEQGIDGLELGEKMQAQAQRFGAETVYAEATAVSLAGAWKKVETSEGDFFGRTLLIATGANPRELGLPRERALVGRGVAYCAACDGMFYRGKTVAVVGGGNSAAADALLLSNLAEQVILIHRRDALRASKIDQQALEQAKNVTIRWNSRVSALLGTDRLTALQLTDTLSGETSALPCDGVFISVGRKPASELLEGQLQLDSSGYILADESTQTSVPGVFAVGDVRVKPLRQVVTAVSDGAVAAHMAERYLQGLGL